MIVRLERIYRGKDYTIGKLYIDDEYFCDTLEDRDRLLDDSMKIDEIQNKKVKGETCIPTGEYSILMNVKSPKYSKQPWMSDVTHGGYVPRIDVVKGFERCINPHR